MKLIYCRNCGDVLVLKFGPPQTCACGKSWGRYIDGIYAEYGGQAMPFGLDSRDLVEAGVRWSLETRAIRCFSIPRVCRTFIHTKAVHTKADPKTETGSTRRTSGDSKQKARRPRKPKTASSSQYLVLDSGQRPS